MPASVESQEHALARAAKICTVLKQIAACGEACPTNRMLADRFGCGTARIVDAFHFLEANGMIVVERGNCTRVVTIRATGHRTGGRVKKLRWPLVAAA